MLAGLQVENPGTEPMPLDKNKMRTEAQTHALQLQNHQLQAQNEAQAKRVADLLMSLNKEAENSNRIKESANRMAYAMERKDLFIGQQDSDDVLYSRFYVLIGQVKTWSVPFAQGRRPFHLDLSSEMMDEFRRVAPAVTDFSRFLQTPKNMRLFVRGYVSLVIAEMLFPTLPSETHPGSRGEDIWMVKDLARSLFQIENNLFHAGEPVFCGIYRLLTVAQDRKTISARELHDWRALTTTLISRLGTSDMAAKAMKAHVTDCSSRIMSIVGDWVADENLKVLEDKLLPILFQAVKLSQTLRCQRACWSVRHLGDAVLQSHQTASSDRVVFFDESTMVDNIGNDSSDEEGSQRQYRKIVEVVVTPGLFKRGNTDGELFDVETCIQRSEVKCRELHTGARIP